jgi:hypothetical protein
MGHVLETQSERDKAVAAAFVKFSLLKSNAPHEIGEVCGRGGFMNDHDWDLINYSLREGKWVGHLFTDVLQDDPDGARTVQVYRRKLSDFEVKALLDDSTSGGIEIAPIEFDDALVTYPVLFGELFPYVNVINLSRGRRVKGGSLVNPTFTSGIAEGTAITPFNTSAFVSAFDTTIYTAVGADELGLDFLEDSPTNVGGIVVQKYGECRSSTANSSR